MEGIGHNLGGRQWGVPGLRVRVHEQLQRAEAIRYDDRRPLPAGGAMRARWGDAGLGRRWISAAHAISTRGPSASLGRARSGWNGRGGLIDIVEEVCEWSNKGGARVSMAIGGHQCRVRKGRRGDRHDHGSSADPLDSENLSRIRMRKAVFEFARGRAPRRYRIFLYAHLLSAKRPLAAMISKPFADRRAISLMHAE